MNADSVIQKLEQLPALLRAEAEDFIDFLLDKAGKQKKGESHLSKAYGSWKGQIEMSDDFDAPLEDFKDYM